MHSAATFADCLLAVGGEHGTSEGAADPDGRTAVAERLLDAALSQLSALGIPADQQASAGPRFYQLLFRVLPVHANSATIWSSPSPHPQIEMH
jgi:hypothetical protein